MSPASFIMQKESSPGMSIREHSTSLTIGADMLWPAGCIYFPSTSHLLLIYFAPALIKPPASKAKEWPPQTCTSLARLGQTLLRRRARLVARLQQKASPAAGPPPGRAEPGAGRWAREKGLLAVAAGAPPDAFPLGTDQTN